MSARYPHRVATSGNVTLNNARKGGNSLMYWFFIKAGPTKSGNDKWIEFDIRELPNTGNAAPLEKMTSEELWACRDGTDDFENLLKRDLQRAADYCARVNALEFLTSKKARAS